MVGFLFNFRIAETVYKCVANTNTTEEDENLKNIRHRKVKEFVGDFNKLFEDLKA